MGLVVAFAAAGVASAADAPAAFTAAVAEGDAAYAERADGASGSAASPVPISRAIAAFRAALRLDPDSSEARFRLLRAFFFRDSFCGIDPTEGRASLEEAKRIADDGTGRLDRRVATLHGDARIEALRKTPGAAALYFWTAVSWGEWALVRGKFAAATSGAGGRIRDLGQMVVDLDPALEQGGGYRILGRLHDQSPHILFITGWVSHEKALDYLRKALELGPRNSVNQFFLAEAIVNHDRTNLAEAQRLLQLCATSPAREEYRVEDTFYAEAARKRLADLRLEPAADEVK